MSATRSGSRTDTSMVGACNRLAYQRTSQLPMSSSNPTASEIRERTEERAALLRAAVNYTARQLLLSVPPMQRSKAESQMLYDCTKDRRAATAETLAALMAIQARADATHRHILSEQIRALELQGREPLALCPLEANEREQVLDAELDAAQLAAARHKAPTYWQAVREKAIAHKAALRHLIDSTARYVTPNTVNTR